MTPPAVLSVELARARQDDLRRASSQALRSSSCGPDGCDGFFSTFVARVRSDVRRLQLGPATDTIVCPC